MQLYPGTVGFERIMRTLQEFGDSIQPNNYPPYNYIKVSDHKYRIEIAVAGFDKDELSADLYEGTLTVSGKKVKKDTEYIFQGIGLRDFTRKFRLADTIQIESVDLVNGLLVIEMHNQIPEAKMLKKLKINTPKEQLLKE